MRIFWAGVPPKKRRHAQLVNPLRTFRGPTAKNKSRVVFVRSFQKLCFTSLTLPTVTWCTVCASSMLFHVTPEYGLLGGGSCFRVPNKKPLHQKAESCQFPEDLFQSSSPPPPFPARALRIASKNRIPAPSAGTSPPSAAPRGAGPRSSRRSPDLQPTPADARVNPQLPTSKLLRRATQAWPRKSFLEKGPSVCKACVLSFSH